MKALSAAKLSIAVTRYKDTIFMPLPPELWRPIEHGCSCDWCKSHPDCPAMWDTLAVGSKAPKNTTDYTYTVHYPEIANPLGKVHHTENTLEVCHV